MIQGLGESQGKVQEVLLDIKGDLLFKAGKVPVLQRAQQPLAPVPCKERAQVLQIGLCRGIAALLGDAILRQFAGKASFQIVEPGSHAFSS
jgi:hypothetical protein